MTHDIAKIDNYSVYSGWVIIKTITPRCGGRPDALLHKAECNSASGRSQYLGVIV